MITFGKVCTGQTSAMPIKINGELKNTVSDAATFFGVSTKAVQGWIRAKIISPPPSEDYGASTIQIFPPDYLATAKRELADHRRNSKQKNNGKHNLTAKEDK
jgi:hypothetical protein